MAPTVRATACRPGALGAGRRPPEGAARGLSQRLDSLEDTPDFFGIGVNVLAAYEGVSCAEYAGRAR